MAGKKQFNNMSLLEKVEYLVKKQLPKEAVLVQQSITVSYSLTVNVTTEDNPFELTSKYYDVTVVYCDNNISIVIKDGDKILRESNINMNSEND